MTQQYFKRRIPEELAGYDLSSAVNAVVPANGKVIVPTDIEVAIPEGTYGRVAPKSGLAAKHHLAVGMSE